MVHRDIKPSNLLIQPPLGEGTPAGGTLKIVDFGLALLPAAIGNDDTLQPERHVVLGTPDYLSPEQATDNRNVDIRSDLYSLGCTFYFLLSGQVPFPGGAAIEKLDRHAQEQPVPVEYHRPAIPPGVAAAVAKLMAKRPEDRFQTPRELADTIAEFAEVQPVRWTDDRTTTSDDLTAADDTDHEGGSGGALSGTLSIAEIASTLNALTKPHTPLQQQGEPARSPSTLWFVAAIAAGFLLGAILIAAAIFWSL
jgi:serine/threonine-protein kinase